MCNDTYTPQNTNASKLKNILKDEFQKLEHTFPKVVGRIRPTYERALSSNDEDYHTILAAIETVRKQYISKSNGH